MSLCQRTAVLLHGYNANELNWERVVWGESPDKPGRIPTAIAVALEMGADVFLFGSSVTRVVDGVEKSSGRLMTELLEARAGTLFHFGGVFPAFQSFSGEWIKLHFYLIEDQERPANTAGEFQAMARVCRNQGIERLVAVSSPDHVSRIMQNGLAQFWGTRLALHFSVRASATLYTEGDGVTPPDRASMANVVVAEPRASVTPLFRRMFGVANNPAALVEIGAVLTKYGK